MPRLAALLVFLVIRLICTGPSLQAAEKSAAQLLPKSVAAYVEISAPPKLIETVLDHPLARRIEAHPGYQKYLESPQYLQYLEFVKQVEAKLGIPLRAAVTSVAADGIYVGGDLATQGVVVLVRSRDEKLTAKVRDTAVELARAAATAEGKPDPIKIDDHRGVALYGLDDVRLGAHGRWLIASNKALLIRAVLNSALDEKTESLSDDTQFKSAYAARPEHATAWAYADLRVISTLTGLQGVFGQKSDNPALELLAGGIVGALPAAAYATGTLHVEQERVGLQLSIPAKVETLARRREFFFGEKGTGQAPPLLQPKQTVLAISAYRDFASLWRNAPDLFNEQVNAQFAEAEAGLSTFFSGRNWRDDILGNLEPGIQLVVARQEYGGEVVPAMKLPAGAIVMQLKNPQETARIFKITFQSAIGFLNVVGGMNGLDPLDVNSEKHKDMLVVAAEYLPPKDKAIRKAAPPHFNASPTAVFKGDTFILSSTRSLAMEVADLLDRKGVVESDPINSQLETNFEVLSEVLADNKEPLIAQNMLEKGHDRPAAEKEIGGLLEVLSLLRDTRLRISADDKTLGVQWEVRLKENDK